MYSGSFTVEEDLRRLGQERALAEEELIAALMRRDDTQTLEATLHKIDQRTDELKLVLGQRRDTAAAANVDQLWRCVYFGERTSTTKDQSLFDETFVTDPVAGDVVGTNVADGTVSLGLDAFASEVCQWAHANTKLRVTSVLIATGCGFFGVIEGPKAATQMVTGKIRRDPRIKFFVDVATIKADVRCCLYGAQIQCIRDGLLSRVIDYVSRSLVNARRFVPYGALELTERGGHPLGSVIDGPKPFVVWSMMLDVNSGAVHRAPQYHDASLMASKALRDACGHIVERFGEFMSACFSLEGGATAAVGVIDFVHRNIPFALQSLTIGTVLLSNRPDIIATGPAFGQGRALLMLAEKTRRPVVISDVAAQRCNRAKCALETFTVDCVNYYTLQSIGDTRLEYPLDAAVRDDRSTNISFVRGALTTDQLRTLFRKIDKGNVGWIGKEAFLRALHTDPDFPKIIHPTLERTVVSEWLTRCNRAGETQIDFDEFAMVCLRIVHAA